MVGRRVIIVGSGGAGKSTLAASLSERLNLPLTRLDDYTLDESDRPRPSDEAKTLIQAIVWGEEWIVEGPIWYIPEHLWHLASTIVWLDLSRWTLVRHLLRRARTMGRLHHRRPWANIKETILRHGRTRRVIKRHLDAARHDGVEVIEIRDSMGARSLVGVSTGLSEKAS